MPRPLSISLSQLIDGAWEQFRASLASYLTLSGWLLVPGLLFVIALLLYPTVDTLVLNQVAGKSLTGLQAAGTILYALTTTLVLPLTSLWVSIATIRLADAQLSRGGRGDVRKAMHEGWTRLLPTLGSSVLFYTLLAIAFIGPWVPGFVLSSLTTGRYDAVWMIVLRTILVLAGVVVSIALPVYLFTLCQFAPVAVVLGDAKVAGSVSESARLVRGRFWTAFFYSLVTKSLFLMLGLAALWVATAIVNIGTSVLIASAPAVALRINTLILTLLSWIVVPMFVTPLLALVDIHLYRNLRETV